jgi:beta-glucosidase
MWKTDVALMKELGLGSYRFSVSWPRVLPDGIGRVNPKGLDFYRNLVDGLLEAGIAPNLTLYHWDLPQALMDKGGWASRDSIRWFEEYSTLIFRTFPDFVPLWSTVNEPVAVFLGWKEKTVFAPGVGDEKAAWQALHHLLVAHGTAVRLFRSLGTKGKIGIVLDLWSRHPARPGNAEDQALAVLEDEFHGLGYLERLFKGEYPDSVRSILEKKSILPAATPEDFSVISEPLDFLGINTYGRFVHTKDDATKRRLEQYRSSHPEEFNSMGWEIWPDALREQVLRVHREYAPGLPLYITENGFCDAADTTGPDGRIRDPRRTSFLRTYLASLAEAIREGANVKGYYVWSLLDNFEWGRYDPRFGLVHTDFGTLKRTIKDSAYWYRDVIRRNGLD